MLRLLLSKAQGRKDFWKPFKPCHVDIHISSWVLSDEYPCTTVSTFIRFFASLCIGQSSHQQHKGLNTGKAYSAVPHYENNCNYLTHHWLVGEELRLCAQSRPLLIVFTNVWWGSLVTEYNGIYKQKSQFKGSPIWLFNSSRSTNLRISYHERVIKIHASNIINSEDTIIVLT